MVCTIPNLSDNWERAESLVRELPRGSRGIDVASIQEYPVSGLIFWGWGSPPVVVFWPEFNFFWLIISEIL